MKFKIEVKFANPVDRYQTTVRTVDSDDFYTEINVLNRMLALGEITFYMVTLDKDESLECTCFNCEPDCEIKPGVKTGLGYMGA